MNRIYKYLLAIAALAAAGFGIYQYTTPDKYQYWKELITKDPKPDGVSEQEYREKLRAGIAGGTGSFTLLRNYTGKQWSASQKEC